MEHRRSVRRPDEIHLRRSPDAQRPVRRHLGRQFLPQPELGPELGGDRRLQFTNGGRLRPSVESPAGVRRQFGRDPPQPRRRRRLDPGVHHRGRPLFRLSPHQSQHHLRIWHDEGLPVHRRRCRLDHPRHPPRFAADRPDPAVAAGSADALPRHLEFGGAEKHQRGPDLDRDFARLRQGLAGGRPSHHSRPPVRLLVSAHGVLHQHEQRRHLDPAPDQRVLQRSGLRSR